MSAQGFRLLCILACVMQFCFSAVAQASTYYGLQVGRVAQSWVEQPEDNQLAGLGVRLGGYWSNFFALEGRFFLGVGDKAQMDEFGERTVKLNHAVGGYGRWDLPFTHWFIPYAIGGITRVEIRDNTALIPERTRSLTGVSYGVGVDLFYSNYGAINAEWVKWIDKDSEALTAFQIGVIGRF